MKVLTIFAHPNPKSFNRAVLDTVTGELRKKNAEVRVKDLYAMNFNPILSGSDFEQLLAGKVPDDIAAEQADVTWADVLIFIYPIWWIGQPAILKGWLDRVMTWDPKPVTLDLVGYILIAHLMSGGYFFMRYRK